MNTFLKVLLVIVVAAVVVHCWPILAFPLGGALLGLSVVATAALCGVSIVLALVIAAVAVVLALATGILAALSPIWLPILLIVGVIALVRRLSRPAA